MPAISIFCPVGCTPMPSPVWVMVAVQWPAAKSPDSITFSTTGTGLASHTIDWTVTDGVKNASATSTLNVVSGPLVVAGGTVTFHGGDSPLQLDSSVLLSDASSPTIASATVTIGGFISGDTLNYNNTVSDITGSYNAGTGVLTLTGTNASVADFKSALQSITYTFGTGGGDPTAGGGHTSDRKSVV